MSPATCFTHCEKKNTLYGPSAASEDINLLKQIYKKSLPNELHALCNKLVIEMSSDLV